MSSSKAIDAATSAKVLVILPSDGEFYDPRQMPFIPNPILRCPRHLGVAEFRLGELLRLPFRL